jgi:cytochrome P450
MSYWNTLKLFSLVLFIGVAPIAQSKEWFEKKPYFLRSVEFYKRFQKDSISLFAELREKQPILRVGKIPMLFPGFNNKSTYIITKKADVLEVLSRPHDFSVKFYGKKIRESIRSNHMLAADNTQYNNQEKPWMRQLFGREDLPRIQKVLEQIIANVFQQAEFKAQNGVVSVEVVNDLARKVPILFIGEYFGFPGPNLETMYRWSKTSQRHFFHNFFNNPFWKWSAKKTGREMIEYTTALVQTKKEEIERGQIGTDLISKMIHLNMMQDSPMPDHRLVINVVGMVMAAVETTQAAVVKSLEYLLSNPQQSGMAKRVAQDNNHYLMMKMVMESLRFNPQAPVLIRHAHKDAIIAQGTPRETMIPKGTLLFVATQSAMFDSEGNNGSEQFSIERPLESYYHFGYGHHRCLGDHINLIQVPLLVKSILSKKNIRVVAPVKVKGPFPESFKLQYDL